MHDVRSRGELEDGPPSLSIDEAPPAVPGRSSAGAAGGAAAGAAGGSTGAPLPQDVRARMEASFGMDLSAVRVHEGEEAGARGAHAYAQGADLHFAPGRYDPHSERGLALLGHELAHVAQHAEGRAPGPQAYGAGGDPALEAEADAMGERAARGERARPEGASSLTARHDPAGAIQRMIDRAAPPNGSAWDVIERYLSRTLINPRKQTFEEAVDEFIATGVTGASDVGREWQALVAIRGQLGQEAAALARIRTIRTTINTRKAQAPDHPNKRGITPSRERYETIPQSRQSQQVAFALRASLVASLLGGYGTRTYYDRRAKRNRTVGTYLDPSDNRRKDIVGYWAESFMLGVLVLPDGTIRVSHSGYMGDSQDDAFRHIVTAAGYTPWTYGDNDYADLQDDYKADAQQALQHDPVHSVQTDHRGKDKVTDGHEWGNPLGVCAAPQVLDDARGLTGPFPAELTGGTQMALTEVWVSANNNSRVAVDDASGHTQRYSGNVDVPSCLSCQHQLRAVMTRLVELRRNVVNRDHVRDEETARDRFQLVQAAKDLRDLLASEADRDRLVQRITGKVDGKSVRTDDDLHALDGLIQSYLDAIDRQAIERTQHPEHVEHDDKTTQRGLAPLVAAEQDTRTYHQEALWQKRIEVGRMLQPDVARAPSSGPQARTPKGKLLPFTQPGTLAEDKDTLADRAHLVNAREDQAQEALRAAQESSHRRAEPELVQVAEEKRVFDRAAYFLGKLAYYQESGYLLADEAKELGAALNSHDKAYRETSGKIGRADPADRATLERLHDELAAAMQGLTNAVGEVEHRLAVGTERVHTQRADEALASALESSHRRESDAPTDTDDGGEDELREQARKAAEASSQRREQAEAEHADRLYSLAMSLAMMYDTRLEDEIRRLVDEDHGNAPPPPADHSDAYIG